MKSIKTAAFIICLAASWPGTSSLLAAEPGDYFPASEGMKWTYQYLKADSDQKQKMKRSVECVGEKPGDKGNTLAVLDVTELGFTSRQTFSLDPQSVDHTQSGRKTYAGDFVFKLPPAHGSSQWSITEEDGTVHQCRAAFGKAQVYKKVYPNCVVVTEKVLKKGRLQNTVIYYYGKGIGLVSMEVYSPKMKLILPESLALVTGPKSLNP